MAEPDGGDDRRSGRDANDTGEQRPPNPAGPHAKPELTDKAKTPGSGVLPNPGDAEGSTTG